MWRTDHCATICSAALFHPPLFLPISLPVRLGQPVVEGPDPSQHVASLPRSQPKMDPHILASLRPRMRVRRGHRLQPVRPPEPNLIKLLDHTPLVFSNQYPN